MTPAELLIQQSMFALEAMGPDARLIEATILLSQAHDKVADYVNQACGLDTDLRPKPNIPRAKLKISREAILEWNPKYETRNGGTPTFHLEYGQ